tara:strand:+ start:49 stop:240 length:192 start_codon:yes stop_codon:yes gene_type:complete
MSKKYIIESKGFTEGLGSCNYSVKRKLQIESLKEKLQTYNKPCFKEECALDRCHIHCGKCENL